MATKAENIYNRWVSQYLVNSGASRARRKGDAGTVGQRKAIGRVKEGARDSAPPGNGTYRLSRSSQKILVACRVGGRIKVGTPPRISLDTILIATTTKP